MKIVDINGNEESFFYCEEGASLTPKRISEKEYSLALDSVAPTTYDVLFVRPDGKYFLPVRSNKPVSKINWVVGGKQICGASVEETIIANCKREVGIDVSKKEAKYLTWLSVLYKDRQQEPQDRACQTVSHVFKIMLTTKEIDSINLDSEYAAASEAWFTSKEVEDGDFHYLVKKAVKVASCSD